MDRMRIAQEKGLGALTEGLLNGSLPDTSLVSTLERSYFEAMRTVIFANHPDLRRFDGEAHGRMVDGFRRLDMERMRLARDQIAHEHASRLPRGGGGIGALGVLNGEIAKKRNHLPIRQLLERAAPVIQQIKPIFLMSPLSVAQFLRPGSISFDLLVVDDRFHLASRSEPPSPNLSLQAKMDEEFGLKIEDFGDEDDVDIAAYLAGIADTVSQKSRWEVKPDAMVLGFFSFSKFLMYRDLDPENWPTGAGLDLHELIKGLPAAVARRMRRLFRKLESACGNRFSRLSGCPCLSEINCVTKRKRSSAKSRTLSQV